ncbi:MAG: XTP/dITP diphosphatase [Candidatus Bathyarchaeota archaeon]|nr:XTP/dITP diphosphatase [Candidatus Bathyarchaeota archaeon]
MKNADNSVSQVCRGKVVFFATGNIHKFLEVRSLLSGYGLSVGMLRLKGDEVQSDSLEEIASKSVQNAYRSSHLPIFVEDAGLFIESLDGFPGPYAAYAYKTIHNRGILKLLHKETNRGATFQSVIAYLDNQTLHPVCFSGKSDGVITTTERVAGTSGFGFDPIFQPDGSKRTFAEMELAEKNSYSHRANAIRKFADWYIKQRSH